MGDVHSASAWSSASNDRPSVLRADAGGVVYLALVPEPGNPFQPGPPLRGRADRVADRGVLGIVAVMIADADDARKFAALEAAGQVRRFPGWAEWNAPRFEVRSGARCRSASTVRH